jgi:hypothetical protein
MEDKRTNRSDTRSLRLSAKSIYGSRTVHTRHFSGIGRGADDGKDRGEQSGNKYETFHTMDAAHTRLPGTHKSPHNVLLLRQYMRKFHHKKRKENTVPLICCVNCFFLV